MWTNWAKNVDKLGKECGYERIPPFFCEDYGGLNFHSEKITEMNMKPFYFTIYFTELVMIFDVRDFLCCLYYLFCLLTGDSYILSKKRYLWHTNRKYYQWLTNKVRGELTKYIVSL